MTLSLAGIYKITNLKTGKIYVGQSKNVYHRKKEHFTALRKGCHENKLMQADWNKDNHGFRFDVLEFCPIAKLNDQERYWILKLNTLQPHGYNISLIPYARKTTIARRKIKHYHKTR